MTKKKGLKDLEKEIMKMENGLLDHAGASIYKLGLHIVGDSAEHYVPVDTGFLRWSFYVSNPKTRGRGVYVNVGAGARYAAAVHELNTPYMTNALKRNAPKAKEIFKTFMDESVEKGHVIRPQKSEIPTTAAGGRARGKREVSKT